MKPVEIEDREERRAGVGPTQHALEGRHQAAAVAEAGERICERERPRPLEQACVVEEADPGAQEDDEDRGDRERVGDHVVRVETRRDEHGERQQPAQERRRGEEAAFELDGVLAVDGLPGGDREQEHPCRPERVEHRPLRIGAGRVEVEEEAVGEHDQREREPHDGPGPPGTAPGEREDEDDDREQYEVGDRVGEVDDHLEPLAVRVGQHDLQHDRGAQRRDGERGDHAVEPDAAVERGDARAHEQGEREVAGRVEREVERVADRDARRAPAVDEVEADVAEREREDSEPEPEPHASLLPRGGGAQETGGRREELETVVDPALGEVVQAVPAQAEGEMRDEKHETGAGDDAPESHHGRSRPGQVGLWQSLGHP